MPQRGRWEDGGAQHGGCRAAVYHRVSTVDQDPAAARTELRAFAQRIGARIVLDVEEVGSGAKNNRPKFLEVMHAATTGKVDVVIVWALDRFGRSALDVLASIERLADHGVRFIATSQSIDVRDRADATSSLTVQILAAVAQFERAMIRDRTRIGMQRARERGSRIGRPPVQKPDPELVRELLEQGRTTAQAVAELGCSAWALRAARRGDLPTRARARAAAIIAGSTSACAENRAVARPGRASPAESRARGGPGH